MKDQIKWDLRGDRRSPCIALIMGYASPADAWGELLLAALSKGYRVLTLDNRGTGQSFKPKDPEEYGVRLMAGDFLRVLDESGVERAHVVGYSLGGCIAMEAALAAPARFKSLALVATTAGGALYVSPGEPVLQGLLEPQGASVQEMFVSTWELCMGKATTARLMPELMRSFEVLSQQLTPRSALKGHMSAYRSFDAVARLGALPRPVLVLTGDLDPLTPPANSERLAKAIPGARLHVMPGIHHYPHIEAPEAYASALLDFFREA